MREREVAVGAAATAARLALVPLRVLARTPVVGSSLANAGREAEADVRREVDEALAGPVPDVVTRAFASGELDARIAEAVRHVLTSPEMRRMLVGETVGYAQETVESVRATAARADARFDRGSAQGRGRYGGVASRGAAFVADLLLAQVSLAVLGGLLALVESLVGNLRPAWLVGLAVGLAWSLAGAAYFVFFWTTSGQTPGLRVVGLRVVGPAGERVGVGRALVRYLGLVLAVIPCGAGFLPVLWDARRRALPDYLAGTFVVRA